MKDAARWNRFKYARMCMTVWYPHLQWEQTISITGITSSVQLRIWPLLCLLLDRMGENIFIFCWTFWWPYSFFLSFHFSYPIQNLCCRNSMPLLLSFLFFSLESQLQSQLDFIMAYILFHLLSVITVIVRLKAKSRIVAFLWLPLLYMLCWRAVVTAFLSLFLGFTPLASEQALSHCFPSVNTVTFSFLSGLCF